MSIARRRQQVVDSAYMASCEIRGHYDDYDAAPFSSMVTDARAAGQ